MPHPGGLGVFRRSRSLQEVWGSTGGQEVRKSTGGLEVCGRSGVLYLEVCVWSFVSGGVCLKVCVEVSMGRRRQAERCLHGSRGLEFCVWRCVSGGVCEEVCVEVCVWRCV